MQPRTREPRPDERPPGATVGRHVKSTGAETVDAATLDELVRRARSARASAYAPYSRYPVGAAVLGDDGAIHGGCNVENAMYGATMCAERVAAFTAVAAGGRRLRAVAVVTRGGGTPCGACRQVLSELGGPEMVVAIASAEDAAYRILSLGDLLPEAWTADDLARGTEESA